MVQLLWKTVWHVLKKLNRIIIWLSSPIPRCRPKRTENRYSNQISYTNIRRSTIRKSQKVETTKMSSNWEMDKMCYTQTTEYCSALKKKRVLTAATTWVNLENMIPRERSQTQKVTYCTILFIWNVQNRKSHRDRRQIGGCQGLGEGTLYWVWDGLGWWKCFGIRGNGYTSSWMYWMLLSFSL